jgi:hypothetical protein
MIVKYSQKWLPFGWKGMAVFPFIFYYEPRYKVPDWLERHEEYHYHHQLRWLVIPWWIAYWILWTIHGYQNHPWEILARRAE